ncbi:MULTISPECIES: Ger(x)C family spore germination protein [Paenibacillus]|uniref:Ger(x)C family spore germination protein n=1 Tax=Paenibacillus TaxID=44249 RepID=UPI0004BA508B|nr:Ger(x)C family spore germination protein [Paenibacillus sp. J14]
MYRQEKRFFLASISLALILLLTGCWNRNELNELSIVLAMGIDKKDDLYEVSLQVVNPNQMSRKQSSERTPTFVLSMRSDSISEAIRKMVGMSSRRLYMSHMQILFVDEATAREGMHEPLDWLLRNNEIRPVFDLIIVRDHSAKEALTFVTSTELFPALDMHKALKLSYKSWAPNIYSQAKEFLESLNKDGVEPVITGLKLGEQADKAQKMDNVKQSPQHANYFFSGVGVFQEDRLVGWMNPSESRAYNYLTNHVDNSLFKVECPNAKEHFTLDVIRPKTKYDPKIVNDHPVLDATVYIEANINELRCKKVDLNKEEDLLKLQKIAADQYVEAINRGIRKAQSLGTDIFGFGEAFHRAYPAKWHVWKNDWDKRFEELDVNLRVTLQIKRNGKIVSPYGMPQNKQE